MKAIVKRYTKFDGVKCGEDIKYTSEEHHYRLVAHHDIIAEYKKHCETQGTTYEWYEEGYYIGNEQEYHVHPMDSNCWCDDMENWLERKGWKLSSHPAEIAYMGKFNMKIFRK